MGMIEALLLQARLAWDGSDADKGMDEAGDNAERMESRFGKALKGIASAFAAAFTVDKIIDFGKECVAAGAEVSAETAAFGQIMGDYADEASAKLGKIAEATGMVDTRLTPYMTSMTAKFKGLGYDVEDATDMASRGLTLAADASAFWDMSLDDSMAHLNSFINGSYEGGEAIGIFANDTQMAAYAVQKGIVKSTKDWANLDEATKQATRLEYAENMMEQSGAAGQAAKESGAYANVMANLAEKWRQFQAQIGQPLIEHVVTPAVNLLSKGIDYLSAAVEYAKDHFDEWRPYIENVGIALGVLAAAVAGFKLGTLISNVASFIKGLDLLKIKTVLMTGAQKALNWVMNLNPIGLIVMAIAGLAAAFVAAYNKSETFRNFVDKLWASIKEKLQPVIESVSNFVQTKLLPAFQQIGQWISSNVIPVLQKLGSWLKDHILSAIQSVASWVSGSLVPTLQTWGNYIKVHILPALQELWSAVMAHVVPAIQLIIAKGKELLTALSPVLDAIKVAWTTTWNNIKIVASTVWNHIKIVVSTALQVIKGIINTVTAVLKGDWSGAWEGIKSIVSSAWNGIRSIVTNLFGGIRSFIGNTLSGIKGVWSNIWEAIKNVAKTKLESARDTIKGIIDKVKGFFNFKIKWPDIPTPHFAISPKGWKVGDLLEGSIPKLSIDWYAKAMDKAAILDGATIFGASNGSLLAGGEAGREVISGEAHLIGLINQAVAQNNEAMLTVLREILGAIRHANEELYDTIVDALTDGTRFKINDREFGRLVRAHA